MEQKKKAIELQIRRQRKAMLVVAACLLLLLGAGWVFFRPNKNNVPQVASLKETWEILESSAREWQEDAYLTNVSFNVTREIIIDPFAIKISAEFHSSHVPSDEMLFVGITNSGKVIKHLIDMMPGQAQESKPEGIYGGVGSRTEIPIYQGEWSIESQDALNIFAKDREVGLCFSSSKASSIELSLNKAYTEYPAWELIIVNCPDKGEYRAYYLNARTGELFDLPNP